MKKNIYIIERQGKGTLNDVNPESLVQISSNWVGSIDLSNYYTKTESDNLLGNKEDIINKVTIWSTTTSNAKYPSEKLVKDSLDSKLDKATTVIGTDTSFNRLPFLNSTNAVKYLLTSGPGERLLSVNSVGNPQTNYTLTEQIIEDTDIITALTSATYTNGISIIAPAGGKVFEKGLIYFDAVAGYLYYAYLNNNVIRFKSA